MLASLKAETCNHILFHQYRLCFGLN